MLETKPGRMWLIAFAYLTRGKLHAAQSNDDVYTRKLNVIS